jgi:hypothetical protein
VASPPPDPFIRLAPLDQLERLAPLMRAAFDLPVAERHFTWKYLENPSGPGVGFEAVGPEGPVAFYGVIPETYLVRGRRTRVYQPVDNMIHPDYRERGLYRALSVRTREHVLSQEGRYTVIAFPSEKLFSFATGRRGWTPLHTIPLVVLPRFVHRVRRRRRGGGEGEVTLTDVARGTAFGPYLTARRHESPTVSVELSPEFLQWRGFDHPYSPGNGCLAWRGSEPIGLCLFSAESGSRCMIRLVEFGSAESFAQALPSLIDYLFERTCASALITWQPVDEARRLALRRCGFLKNPLGRGPGSTRYAFIARSEPPQVHGQDWVRSTFDVQPIMRD